MAISELDCKDWESYLSLRYQLGNYKGKIEGETYIEQSQNFASKYSLMKNQGAIIYVFKKDGNIIGTGKLVIEYKFFQNVAHIEDVVIDEKHRGHGYGQKIINHIIEIAKLKGCYKVVLTCKENLENFYSKSGLVKNEICMTYFYM